MQTRPLRNTVLFACFALSLTSCQTDKSPAFSEEEREKVQEREKAIPTEKDEERPFTFYYQQLVVALASGDAAGFNGLIHPEFGCYLIEAPGAIPVITRITNMDNALRKGSERLIMDSNDVFLTFPLTEDRLPTIDCDSPEGFYSKEGTYVEDVNNLAEEKIWKYIGLDSAAQNSISELANTVNKTIVNTAGFTAYFSKIGTEWYITFFDIRVPCTA